MLQQLCYRGVLLMLGIREGHAAFGVLQRGVGVGVEQCLHDRGAAIASSKHQGGGAVGVLQVDARAALQQHPHHRLLSSCGGNYQKRRIIAFCATLIQAAALVQPCSHSLCIALARRVPHDFRQLRSRKPLGVLPQHLPCRGVLLLLGQRKRRLTEALQRGIGLGVEQRLHDRGLAFGRSVHQGGAVDGVLHVDASAALQQHPHHRLLPSHGGRHQHRRAATLRAARVQATTRVQPRSYSLRLALSRRP
eukprot:scaffold124368_cov75-Phaeocystis_antarctica.AAC.2